MISIPPYHPLFRQMITPREAMRPDLRTTPDLPGFYSHTETRKDEEEGFTFDRLLDEIRKIRREPIVDKISCGSREVAGAVMAQMRPAPPGTPALFSLPIVIDDTLAPDVIKMGPLRFRIKMGEEEDE